MDYLHTDLGTVRAGSVVIARLSGTEANVLLVDPTNLERYRRGQSYHYHGGHFTPVASTHHRAPDRPLARRGRPRRLCRQPACLRRGDGGMNSLSHPQRMMDGGR